MDVCEVRLDRTEAVATVTLNRPGRRNAMNGLMWESLDRVTQELAAKLPRAVILTGVGDVFSAGADVTPGDPHNAAMAEAIQKKEPTKVRESLLRIRNVMDRFLGLPVPIIAALNGLAYGGAAELAVRCDLRVMDSAASLCFSEVRLGLMPDLGGGVALTRLVGPGIASDLILTARKLGAQEALALGVVNRVSEPGKAHEVANSLAREIAANGPRAVRAALAIIRHSHHLEFATALESELGAASELIATGECVYGISALFSKARPEFPDA